jgi:hypothetical protein
MQKEGRGGWKEAGGEDAAGGRTGTGTGNQTPKGVIAAALKELRQQPADSGLTDKEDSANGREQETDK